MSYGSDGWIDIHKQLSNRVQKNNKIPRTSQVSSPPDIEYQKRNEAALHSKFCPHRGYRGGEWDDIFLSDIDVGEARERMHRLEILSL
jgi:hypothetical protein